MSETLLQHHKFYPFHCWRYTCSIGFDLKHIHYLYNIAAIDTLSVLLEYICVRFIGKAYVLLEYIASYIIQFRGLYNYTERFTI